VSYHSSKTAWIILVTFNLTYWRLLFVGLPTFTLSKRIESWNLEEITGPTRHSCYAMHVFPSLFVFAFCNSMRIRCSGCCFMILHITVGRRETCSSSGSMGTMCYVKCKGQGFGDLWHYTVTFKVFGNHLNEWWVRPQPVNSVLHDSLAVIV
jgi:hypothetical protein